MSPAMTRIKVVFPEPFGPVRISASPSETENDSRENTYRSPRMTANSSAASCICMAIMLGREG
jgi:hypothetical protein